MATLEELLELMRKFPRDFPDEKEPPGDCADEKWRYSSSEWLEDDGYDDWKEESGWNDVYGSDVDACDIIEFRD